MSLAKMSDVLRVRPVDPALFHPRQREFRDSPARFLSFMAGTRSGKTFASARVFYERVCRDIAKHPKEFLHYWILSPDFPLGKVALRELFGVIPDKHVKKWISTSRELWLYPNVLIEFKSGENPERLVGVKLRGAWIDEVARCKRAVWVYVRQRLTDYRGWCLFSTTPLGRNWYYEEILRRGDPSDAIHDPAYFNVHCKTIENPFIPREEVEAARRQLPAKYFKRDYEASLDSFMGQIYDEFEWNVHTVPLSEFRKRTRDNSLQFVRFLAGQDFGFSNPAATVIGGISKSGDLWVVDEVYRPGMLPTDLISELRRLQGLWKFDMIYADPEDPAYHAQISQAGIPICKSDNNVLGGIRQVSLALHFGKPAPAPRIFFVRESVPNLLRELPPYRWAETSGEVLIEKPAPNQNDHACDALRYLVMGARSGEMLEKSERLIW